jgi:hypothetical protein
MSFNAKLRDLFYGRGNTSRLNSPLRKITPGVTGTTWRGTGFDDPPPEPVELDEENLPWELKEDSPG